MELRRLDIYWFENVRFQFNLNVIRPDFFGKEASITDSPNTFVST